MIKRIRSNRMKFNPDGSSYLEDENGESHYEICSSDSFAGYTRVNEKIDWQYYGIIGGLIIGWLFVCYCLFIKN